MEEEQQYLANAEIKKAEGEKTAAILRAQGRAEEIRLVQQQLTRSPNYIELVKWKGYADGILERLSLWTRQCFWSWNFSYKRS